MSDLIKVPEWFDKIYKSVQLDYGSASYVKMKFIQALVKQGWGFGFTEEIINDDKLRLTKSTIEYIQKVEKQEDINLYVLDNKYDLIKALIDGYEVEEGQYIVITKTPDSATLSMLTPTNVFPQHLTTPYRKIYYVNDKHQEDYISIQEDVLSSGLIMGEFSSDILSLINGKPELIMNKEEAEKLMNSYRMMIPVKS